MMKRQIRDLSGSSLIPQTCQSYILINYLAGSDKTIPSKCHDSKQRRVYCEKSVVKIGAQGPSNVATISVDMDVFTSFEQ